MPRAIDLHVHPPLPSGASSTGGLSLGPTPRPTPEEMADLFTEHDLFGVLLAINDESVSGVPYTGNDEIAALVARWPDRFIGFASVDPHQGRRAVQEIGRAVRDLGLRGLKFHAGAQRFYANDPRCYPLWEAAQELQVPVLFHTGTTLLGQGQPGGGGVQLEWTKPMPYIDDVAAEFPDLTIIMAHPAWPWQDEQLAMLVHKPNCYMDLSGWAMEYVQPNLVQYANTLVQDKVLFGSDYPGFSLERWFQGWERAAFRDSVRRKILFDNANALLGLNLAYTGE